MDVVLQKHWMRCLSGRRYVVANRNGCNHDHASAGRDSDETGQRNAPILWGGSSCCRRERAASRTECGWQANHSPALAFDVAHDLWRQGPVSAAILERI